MGQRVANGASCIHPDDIIVNAPITDAASRKAIVTCSCRKTTRFSEAGPLVWSHGNNQENGAALPTACQDWAATKAAYRLFDNPRVSESTILAGHFAATKSRMAAAKGPILLLHDTTEFN